MAAEPNPVGLALDNDDRVIDLTDPAEPSARARPPRLRRILVAADVCVLAVAAEVGLAVTDTGGGRPVVLPVVVLAGLLLLAAAGLYRRRICVARRTEIVRSTAVAGGLGLVALVIFRMLGEPVDPALTLAAVWFVGFSAERGMLRAWIDQRRAGGDYGSPTVVVGGSYEGARETAGFLQEHSWLGFDVRGMVCPEPGDDPDVPWLGRPEDLMAAVHRARAAGVLLDAATLSRGQLNGAVHDLNSLGVHLHIWCGVQGLTPQRVTLTSLADELVLHVAPTRLTRRQVAAKRALDVTLAGMMLLLALPVLVVCGLLVWLQDGGPILFRQQRIGHGGERFTLYKLRTMVPDADRTRATLLADNRREGPLFKMARDPRVTPVGRFLRAASLDELPQLVNVLEGTMSLVGPRPALPEEVERFDEQLRARLRVKPGVTGLWQVEARDRPSFDLYRRYDLLYVRNWSLLGDLGIILRTITVVLTRTVRTFGPARWRGGHVGE